jgi:hypothetical protein
MLPAEHCLCAILMQSIHDGKNVSNIVFQCCASTVPYETTVYKTVEKFQKPDSVVQRRKYKTAMF